MSESHFVIGKPYARRDIHERIGGSIQAMLPTVDRRLVCCCLKRKINRLYPSKLLIGDFPQKYPVARQWAEEKYHVPFFVMEEARDGWVYTGDFRVSRYSEDPEVVEQMKIDGDDPDVRIVLYLEKR